MKVFPGLNPRRLNRLMCESIDTMRLDLRGLTVLTEAATGAYSTTPVLAAMAGADHVFAVTRDSSHGTVAEVRAQTGALASLAEVADRLTILDTKPANVVALADIVTNSGHLRSIDRQMIESMKSTAVIPLMYEAWEFRQGDVAIEVAKERGIPVAGTNERHDAVNVFAYLGAMALKLMFEAGVATVDSRIGLLCDNPFEPYIKRALCQVGANVSVGTAVKDMTSQRALDAVLVALLPTERDVLGRDDLDMIRRRFPGAVVVQYWGDIDRDATSKLEVPVWPPAPPRRGHMAVLPSDIGPEPIVRLQAGGLKVGEVLSRARNGTVSNSDWSFVDARLS